MSRDKQTEIHEIAKRMSEAISTEMELRYISDERKLEAALKENGWCKASDLAEEIFAEIEKNYIEFYDRVCSNHELKLPEVVKELCMYLLNEEFMRIAELKKKYTEGK